MSEQLYVCACEQYYENVHHDQCPAKRQYDALLARAEAAGAEVASSRAAQDDAYVCGRKEAEKELSAFQAENAAQKKIIKEREAENLSFAQEINRLSAELSTQRKIAGRRAVMDKFILFVVVPCLVSAMLLLATF